MRYLHLIPLLGAGGLLAWALVDWPAVAAWTGGLLLWSAG